MNSGDPAGTGYWATTLPLQRPQTFPARMTPAARRHLERQYATIEITDSVAMMGASREPVATAQPPQPAEPRLYRTGRNIQFSCKVTQALHDEVHALTDELARRMQRQVPGMRWTVEMTVERMVAAPRKELGEE